MDAECPALEVVGISKKFGGVQALTSVSFDVRAGEVVAVVGANGAGKSTIVRILGGVFKPDSGAIRVGGRHVEIPNVNASRRLGIEIVYQDLGLVPNMDAPYNLFLGRTPRRFGLFVDRPVMARETREVLDALHISTLKDLAVTVDSLSGGQRQAIAIGRTIAFDQPIVILDEPAAALGVEETGEVLELIERLRERGTAVIFVSHNMDHIMRLANRILVIRNGCSIYQVPRSEVDINQVMQMIMIGTL